MVQSGTINGKNVVYEKDQYGTWICVMNYEHYQNNDPSVTPGSTFPQLPNGKTNSSDVQSLGSNGELVHVDNINQYGTWNVDAVRLEATTENHSRKIHYFTQNQTVIDAVTTSQTTAEAGSSDLQDQTTFYNDHNANLPDAAGNQTSSNANRIFGYEFPMYQGGNYHWALSGNGNRWEVDDYPNNDSNSTVHRIWVRVPDSTFPFEVNLTENINVNDFKTVFKIGDTTEIVLSEKLDVNEQTVKQLFQVFTENLSETLNLNDTAPIVQDQLTGHYRFNQTLLDQVTLQNGTSYGSTYTSNGIAGTYAAEFATDPDYLALQPDSFTDWYNNNPISVSLWLKTTNQGVAFGVIGGEGNESNPSNANGHVPAVTVSGNGNGKANVSLVWHGNTTWVSSTTNVDDGNWHHIVGTYNPSTDTEKIYVDGVEEGSRSPGSLQDFNSGNYAYLVGTEIGTNSSWASLSDTNFQGDIDEFRAYSKELSSNEVTELYEEQINTSNLQVSTLKKLSEQTSLTDKINKTFSKKLSQTIQILENFSRVFTPKKLDLTENIQVRDADPKEIRDIIRQNLGIEDTKSKTAQLERPLQETTSVSTQTTKKTLRTLQQNININTQLTKKTLKTLEENFILNLNDRESFKANIVKSETVSIQLLQSKKTLKKLQASLNLSEKLARKADYKRNQLETVKVEENTSKKTSIKKQETLALNDTTQKISETIRRLTETVNLQETVNSNVTQAIQKIDVTETLNISANTKKQVSKTLQQTINISDTLKLGGDVNLSLRRTVLKKGLIQNLANALKTFNETTLLKKPNKYLKQTSPRTAKTLVNANQYKSEKRKYNTVEQV